MQISNVERSALILNKDAKDVATKKLQFDPNADIVGIVLYEIILQSVEDEIARYASSIEMTSQQQEELIMRCLEQFENAVVTTAYIV